VRLNAEALVGPGRREIDSHRVEGLSDVEQWRYMVVKLLPLFDVQERRRWGRSR